MRQGLGVFFSSSLKFSDPEPVRSNVETCWRTISQRSMSVDEGSYCLLSWLVTSILLRIAYARRYFTVLYLFKYKRNKIGKQ